MLVKYINFIRYKSIFLGILCLFLQNSASAQDVNYKVHAMFMYHFTKHIDWPADKKNGDFIIGVYGNSPIEAELEVIASSKKAGTQSIVIKKIVSEVESNNCHIVFVSNGKSGSLDGILKAINTKPILVVSEKNGFGKKGSCLNFIIEDEKLKFEINKQSIESKGLKISGDLLKLGIVL